MGTNFYLKKTVESKKLVEEQYKFMLIENLNKLLPRERHRYLSKLFGVLTRTGLAEFKRDLMYSSMNAHEILQKSYADFDEKHKKYSMVFTHFCTKKEITFTDLDLISDLINAKIQEFTEKEGYHIGKRSAAGHYCKKCHVTLCDGGFEGIHASDTGFYEECPICHTKDDVDYVCSFNWQWSKNFWMSIFSELDNVIILDEYGDEFSINEFLNGELQNVPFNMQAEEKEYVFS